ncbi:LAFE_0C11056g1_1 [Lachancea fermentati]|uniref:LAFE_0C11056g1_1 n=1 Tax=Lachancea fermentati TaxID=4955 RepID=A0A1G4MA69_LACFM|nr:LAFE_0C11056g1_1 [Lachancea fermentati]
MLTYAAFTTVAIVWLVYRLFQFLGIPVWRIVSTLGLQVPHTAKVSIDGITSTAITLRWENEPYETTYKSNSPISHYVLYLNNVKIGAFPNVATSLYTCCSLTGLSPQTQYQFDFVTVNKHGFMNKVPSIYVMTKCETDKASDRYLTINVEDNETASLRTPNFPADAKWRKSQVSTPVDSPTSYASLTSLQDLEDFSINDLKKILICAQEDLHDVLQQQTSILQDFRESEIQLQLELDNLKTQWSHEIDLRKSLKSSIKSLENSKLLYDLKRGKLEKNIEQVRGKIEKMKNDMIKWEVEQKDQLKQDILEEKYSQEKAQVMEEINKARKKISVLQEDISAQEEENKKLILIKKSLDANGSSPHLAQMNPSAKRESQKDSHPPLSLSAILKKINEFTIEKNGLLTGAGQEFLNSLSENSCVTSKIREEIGKDMELEAEWRAKKSKLRKKVDLLEKTWNELNFSNKSMIANLAAQPYTVGNAKQTPLGSSGVAPQLVLHDPTTYVDAESHQQSFGSPPFTTASDSMAFSNWPIQQTDSHLHDSARSPQVQYINEDQNFEYDNTNHLLSGLQNMISEADYQTSNISTSKLYTTDQLDSYWNTNSRPAGVLGGNGMYSNAGVESPSLPLLSPYLIGQRDSFNQNTQSTPPNMHTSLNESATPLLGNDSIFTEPEQMRATEKVNQISMHEDVISLTSNSKQDLSATPPVEILRQDGDPAADGAFHSTNFNSIWSNPNTNSASSFSETPKLSTPKHGHHRSGSRGSWGLSQFMHRSPVSTTTESKSTTESASSPRHNGDSKDKDHQSGNGRRMSKLLSRSGMNHLFKLPSHDTS